MFFKIFPILKKSLLIRQHRSHKIQLDESDRPWKLRRQVFASFARRAVYFNGPRQIEFDFELLELRKLNDRTPLVIEKIQLFNQQLFPSARVVLLKCVQRLKLNVYWNLSGLHFIKFDINARTWAHSLKV